MLRKALLAIVLALTAANAAAAYDAQPRHGLSLEGSWLFNAAASDDLDKLVSGLIEKEEKERQRWRRRMQEEDPFSTPEQVPSLTDPANRRAAEKQLRRMLGVTDKLDIEQEGAHVEIATDYDARRVEAGSSTQVSMRNGDLADSRVGWDGEWFVIDRKVPRGAHVLERLRVVKGTGQLEYVIKWSGDTELSGVKLRRIFDKSTIEAAPADPASGPVR